jgi:hypothetical protein
MALRMEPGRRGKRSANRIATRRENRKLKPDEGERRANHG